MTTVTWWSTSMLLIYIIYKLTLFIHRIIWKPLQTQRFLSSQGINGPGYRFLLGNAKQLIQLRNKALAEPMPTISHDVLHRVSPHHSAWSKEYGRNFAFWIGPKAQLVLGEPELIKEILSNKEGVFTKAKLFSAFLQKIFGDGIVMAEGEKWAKLRKLANFALHGENLKGMVPDMITSVEMMLERWKDYDGKEIEVHKEFKILSSEVISRTAFGSSFEEGQQIFFMLNKIAKLSERNTFKFRLPIFRNDEKEADMMIKGIQRSIMQMVKMREEKAKNGEIEAFGNDYLGLLINASREDDESKKISMEELIDECKIMYVAGQETTNTLLSWTILLLSIHQDWQEAAREEVINQFGVNTSPDVDGIARLKTMSMILSETLRLYPPAYGGFIRDVRRDVKLGKLIVPAGVQVHIPIMALHHDPKIWGEDVHLFKPDRFSGGIDKATNNNSNAFMPFGMGPHMCAGFNFATNEAKIAIAMILQRFSFALSPDYLHSPFAVMAIRPENGISVILNVILKPLQTQRFLRSQGINGPGYHFLLGNVKEFIQLKKEAMAKPMPTISHDVLHRAAPHLSAWSKQYGKRKPLLKC
ncbi:Cytochrome P450 CYP749A22 [Linum perenne]